jgi:hypothetical protein
MNDWVFLLNIRRHPVFCSHHRIRMYTYQGMRVNPIANAGNAQVPANEVIVINVAMIKTILNGITPAIRNRIMYSPGLVFMVIPFSSISRLFQSHRPKKAKTPSPAIVPKDNISLVRSVDRKYTMNGMETRVKKTAQRRT